MWPLLPRSRVYEKDSVCRTASNRPQRSGSSLQVASLAVLPVSRISRAAGDFSARPRCHAAHTIR